MRKWLSLSGFFLSACLFTQAQAAGFIINKELVDGGRFSPTDGILQMDVTAPTTFTVYTSPGSASHPVTCTLDQPSSVAPLDCGLLPISISKSDAGYTFNFSVLQRKIQPWVGIYIDAQQKDLLWIRSDDLKRLKWKMIGIAEWLTSGNGLAMTSNNAASQMVMHAFPMGNSDVVGRCGPLSLNHDPGLWLSGMRQNGQVSNGWLGVYCIKKESNAGDGQLVSECIDEDRKSRSNPTYCEGWIPWRTEAGALLVYPAQGLPVVAPVDKFELPSRRTDNDN